MLEVKSNMLIERYEKATVYWRWKLFVAHGVIYGVVTA